MMHFRLVRGHDTHFDRKIQRADEQFKFVEQFRLGYGILGPTEVRILLIVLNTVALLSGPIPFQAFGVGATVFDIAGVATTLSMTGMLLRRIVRNLRHLGRLEPANVVKEPADQR